MRRRSSARSPSWLPRASRRSPSASCSPSSIRRMSGGRARSSARSHPRIMVSLVLRGRSGVPRIRAHLRHRLRCLYQAGGRPLSRRAWSAISRRRGVQAPLQIMQSRGGISVGAHRAAAAGAAVPVGTRGRRDRRSRGRPRGSASTISSPSTSAAPAATSRWSAAAQPLIRAEGEIGGYTVRVPMVDVNAIGAGGGSIAWIDGAGSLRVGPQSAGSEPGPACYGRGGERGDGDRCLGGARLHRSRTISPAGPLRLVAGAGARRRSRRRSREPLGMPLETAALGIHRVRQRPDGGGDPARLDRPRHRSPRLHAAAARRRRAAARDGARARARHSTRIAVPPHPGVLSAAGLLVRADRARESPPPFRAPLAGLDWPEVRRALDELDQACAELMRERGRAAPRTAQIFYSPISATSASPIISRFRCRADAAGSARRRSTADFRAAHDRVYGHSTDGAGAHRQSAQHPPQRRAADRGRPPMRRDGDGRAQGRAPILTAESGRLRRGRRSTSARRWRLACSFAGPAIVEQADTTTLIEPAGVRDGRRRTAPLIITARLREHCS